jgi:hypothetical protein
MSRAKGNRTIREKAQPYYEYLGFSITRTESVSRYSKEQDLFANIFDDEDEDYRDTGFDLMGIKTDSVVLVQVATNSPKTQKWYKEFARRYANHVVQVHVFTHYDRDGFRIQNYLPDGRIEETDYRLSKNKHAKRTIWWWQKDDEDQ